MMCPLCPATGWLGGWLGGYFGVNPPEHWKGRVISAFITANMVCVTAIALKYFWGISLCSPGRTQMEKIAIAGIKAVLMSIVYSIGVNFLLNRYIYSKAVDKGTEEESTTAAKPCCCKNKS